MKNKNVRRGMAIFVAAVAAAVAVGVAPAPAQAHGHGHFELPGLLLLSPGKGSLADDPMATFSTTKACPADHRAAANVSLRGPDGLPRQLSSNILPTSARPQGTVDSALLFTVQADDLQTGYYEIDLVCYDDNSDLVKADINLIKIDVAAGTWKALVR